MRSNAFAALRALLRDNRGATAVEYGLILAFIVLAMFAALDGLGGATVRMWGHVANKVVELTV